ncbi:MAG: hypothetical protein KKE64_07920, partial [Candidatus Omnitrophica bacterium]|nr:hypothetical protein [Candidatus Omnitrophota bacterium]
EALVDSLTASFREFELDKIEDLANPSSKAEERKIARWQAKREATLDLVSEKISRDNVVNWVLGKKSLLVEEWEQELKEVDGKFREAASVEQVNSDELKKLNSRKVELTAKLLGYESAMDSAVLSSFEHQKYTSADLEKFKKEIIQRIDKVQNDAIDKTQGPTRIRELSREKALVRLDMVNSAISYHSGIDTTAVYKMQDLERELKDLDKKVDRERKALVVDKMLEKSGLPATLSIKNLIEQKTIFQVSAKAAMHDRVMKRLGEDRLADTIVTKTMEFVDVLIANDPVLKKAANKEKEEVRNGLMTAIGEAIKAEDMTSYKRLYAGVDTTSGLIPKFQEIWNVISEGIGKELSKDKTKDSKLMETLKAKAEEYIERMSKEAQSWEKGVNKIDIRLLEGLTEKAGVDLKDKTGFELAKEIDLLSYQLQEKELEVRANGMLGIKGGKKTDLLVNDILKNTVEGETRDLKREAIGKLEVTPWTRFMDVRKGNKYGVSAHNEVVGAGKDRKYNLWVSSQKDTWDNFRLNLNSGWSLTTSKDNNLGGYNLFHELLHLAADDNMLALDLKGDIRRDNDSMAATEGLVRWFTLEGMAKRKMNQVAQNPDVIGLVTGKKRINGVDALVKESAVRKLGPIYLGGGSSEVRSEFAKLMRMPGGKQMVDTGLLGQAAYLGRFQGFGGTNGASFRGNIEFIERLDKAKMDIGGKDEEFIEPKDIAGDDDQATSGDELSSSSSLVQELPHMIRSINDGYVEKVKAARDDEHLYHVTNVGALKEIQRHGLEPMQPEGESAEQFGVWFTRKEENFGRRYYDSALQVILRVNEDKLKALDAASLSRTESGTVFTNTIPAKDGYIEFFNTITNKWVNLKDYKGELSVIADNLLDLRDEDKVVLKGLEEDASLENAKALYQRLAGVIEAMKTDANTYLLKIDVVPQRFLYSALRQMGVPSESAETLAYLIFFKTVKTFAQNRIFATRFSGPVSSQGAEFVISEIVDPLINQLPLEYGNFFRSLPEYNALSSTEDIAALFGDNALLFGEEDASSSAIESESVRSAAELAQELVGAKYGKITAAGSSALSFDKATWNGIGKNEIPQLVSKISQRLGDEQDLVLKTAKLISFNNIDTSSVTGRMKTIELPGLDSYQAAFNDLILTTGDKEISTSGLAGCRAVVIQGRQFDKPVNGLLHLHFATDFGKAMQDLRKLLKEQRIYIDNMFIAFTQGNEESLPEGVSSLTVPSTIDKLVVGPKGISFTLPDNIQVNNVVNIDLAGSKRGNGQFNLAWSGLQNDETRGLADDMLMQDIKKHGSSPLIPSTPLPVSGTSVPLNSMPKALPISSTGANSVGAVVSGMSQTVSSSSLSLAMDRAKNKMAIMPNNSIYGKVDPKDISQAHRFDVLTRISARGPPIKIATNLLLEVSSWLQTNEQNLNNILGALIRTESNTVAYARKQAKAIVRVLEQYLSRRGSGGAYSERVSGLTYNIGRAREIWSAASSLSELGQKGYLREELSVSGNKISGSADSTELSGTGGAEGAYSPLYATEGLPEAWEAAPGYDLSAGETLSLNPDSMKTTSSTAGEKDLQILSKTHIEEGASSETTSSSTIEDPTDVIHALTVLNAELLSRKEAKLDTKTHAQDAIEEYQENQWLRAEEEVYFTLGKYAGGRGLKNGVRADNPEVRLKEIQAIAIALERNPKEMKLKLSDEANLRKLVEEGELLLAQILRENKDLRKLFYRYKNPIDTRIQFKLMELTQGDIKTLQGTVGVVKEEVGAVKEEVGAVKEEVGAVKEEVGAVKEEVGAVKEE